MKKEIINYIIATRAKITQGSVLYMPLYNYLNEEKQEVIQEMMELYPSWDLIDEVEFDEFYDKVGEVLDNYYEGIKEDIYGDF